MADLLLPRNGAALDGMGAARVPRHTERRLEEIVGRGLESRLRLDVGALATHAALVHTAGLSKAEADFITLAPLGEARYQAIVDAYALVAVAEIRGDLS